MKSLQLDRLKEEYLRKKMFAVDYDAREKAELLELRNKINNLKSGL
ncbi:MAG: hypothetical protein GPJ54_01300 [Candidatus Heimdallarchaeota archaeon]|nr:hypothetical protein [Candidatus Heimdallarchaeota archaeon]